MKRKLKKTVTVIACIVAGIIAVIFIAGLFISSNLEKIVHTTLIEQVSKSTNGLYQLDIRKINTKKSKGLLQLRDIEFYTNNSVLNSLKKAGKTPKNTINWKADLVELEISNLSTLQENGYLTISRFAVLAPDIFITNNTITKDTASFEIQSSNSSKQSGLYKVIAPFFSTIGIDKIEVIDGNVTYNIEQKADTLQYTANKIQIKIDSILIDSTFTVQHNLIPRCYDARVEAKNLKTLMPNKLYTFNIGQITMRLSDSTITIDSMHLKPEYGKYEFAKRDPKHSDITEVRAQQVILSGLHINQLLAGNGLTVDSTHIEKAFVTSFKNKKIHAPQKEKPLFHKLIHKVPIPFSAPIITISNSEAIYEELAEEGETPGKVNFKHLNASVIGLTNRTENQKHHFTLYANARMFGKGLLNATFVFPVDPHNDNFTVTGTLGNMDMTLANQIAMPLANLKIKSGEVNHIDFKILANSKQATLNMTFLYDNFSVELYKVKDHQLHKKGLLSKLANNIVIRSSNPLKNKLLRKVETHTDRDPHKSHFNYLWRIFRDGIKESVGVPSF